MTQEDLRFLMSMFIEGGVAHLKRTSKLEPAAFLFYKNRSINILLNYNDEETKEYCIRGLKDIVDYTKPEAVIVVEDTFIHIEDEKDVAKLTKKFLELKKEGKVTRTAIVARGLMPKLKIYYKLDYTMNEEGPVFDNAIKELRKPVIEDYFNNLFPE